MTGTLKSVKSYIFFPRHFYGRKPKISNHLAEISRFPGTYRPNRQLCNQYTKQGRD